MQLHGGATICLPDTHPCSTEIRRRAPAISVMHIRHSPRLCLATTPLGSNPPSPVPSVPPFPPSTIELCLDDPTLLVLLPSIIVQRGIFSCA